MHKQLFSLVLDYSDEDMGYDGVEEEDEEGADKLKLKGEVSDDDSAGFIITGTFFFLHF